MAERHNNCRNHGRYYPHGISNNFSVHSHSMSPSTISTILKVQQKHRCLNPAISYSLHDRTSNGYEWLLPAWIAEERTMPSGRIYRYYYDPSGHLYRTKNEVLAAWEEAGIVVLDS